MTADESSLLIEAFGPLAPHRTLTLDSPLQFLLNKYYRRKLESMCVTNTCGPSVCRPGENVNKATKLISELDKT